MQYYNEARYVWLTHAVFAHCSKTVGNTDGEHGYDRQYSRTYVEMRTQIDSPSVKPKRKFNVRLVSGPVKK